MAREKPLDFNVVQTWLAAWNETELYSDAAVRHLASLIEDPRCLVVVTRGVGGEARSLVFRRWRLFSPIPPPARSELGSRPARYISTISPPAGYTSKIPPMFPGSAPPAAPSSGQLWHHVDIQSAKLFPRRKLGKVFRWDGTNWTHAGYVRDEPVIIKQGLEPCGFMEALAFAHENAKWGGEQVIYTHDDSTLGNA